jgi:hypothetical protein
MVLTPPQSSDDALRFIDQIIADERLHALIEATQSEGLADMRRYAVSLQDRLGANEREQMERPLQRWASWDGGEGAPPQCSRTAWLAWLRGFAGRWDLRCGRERDRIPTSIDVLPPRVAGLVDALAEEWGMHGPREVAGAFGAAVVLGGFLASNLNRAAAAAQLLRDGAVSFPLAIGLASQRPLPTAEHRQAVALGATDGTESDTMAFAMARAFGVDPSRWLPRQGYRELVGEDGLRLLVTEVTLLSNGSRPKTGGSFAWLLKSGLLDIGSGVLSVTTPLYWIQNHVNLLTQLPQTGVSLVTAGGTAENAGAPQPVYRSQHYLQEIKAAIDVLPELLVWPGG